MLYQTTFSLVMDAPGIQEKWLRNEPGNHKKKTMADGTRKPSKRSFEQMTRPNTEQKKTLCPKENPLGGQKAANEPRIATVLRIWAAQEPK